ncbi:MAG: hypothetical protein CLLPBCKN_000828 [Chroococcidiopsis cubana SAG 39.79]|uniref:response regulator n=1 Tax=Chroococcidiopsis cubana TaxID=171392 RepID=UPI002AC66ABB|nr:hypothetical protein [Chroococcidiopsis cubana]MDZ4871440.1 hypothetical protein [Chroococcidiopsis cubana SAG 39.79]
MVEVPPRQHYRRVIGLAPDQPKYRILVVEDKWENRQLLVKMLESVGFEVREAENGEEGVAIWGKLATTINLDGYANASDGWL